MHIYTYVYIDNIARGAQSEKEAKFGDVQIRAWKLSDPTSAGFADLEVFF
jgi:hypothetical protein